MTRGVAVILLQMANRVGPQCEAAEYENLAGEKSLLQGGLVVAIDGSIEPSNDGTVELSVKAPMSVSKPADLG